MLEFEPDFERRSCFVDKGQAELKNRRCLKPACTFHGRVGSGNIVRHGFYTTKTIRCGRCGKTFRDVRHGLHNEIRETASIPVRQVRKDVLFDQRHARTTVSSIEGRLSTQWSL